MKSIISKAPMKIGILGGTFDPIHTTHVSMAKHAKQQLNLDQVWFIPVNVPPHKYREQLTSSEHRLAMLRLALADEPTFLIQDLELQRKTVSYTYETIQQLRDQYPNTEFYFLIGADNVEGLSRWKELEYLLSEVHFVAFKRTGHTIESKYPIILLDWEEQVMSSTAARQLGGYQYLDERVVRYMLEYRLYGLTAIHMLVAKNMPYKRFIHTMGVVETAITLARQHGLNELQCHAAALLHDYAKAMPKYQLQVMMEQYFPNEPFIPQVAHAFVGSHIIQTELLVTDTVVIDAVKYHTTGHPNMDEIAMCIFVADYIEPNRNFAGVEQARELAKTDIKLAAYYAVVKTNNHLRNQGLTIHHDSQALEEMLEKAIRK
ncbi:MAG: nicotinate-nucleotide adenylyltransferase [Culicoidibacterales bacterium]